jgi:hypothetical protein
MEYLSSIICYLLSSSFHFIIIDRAYIISRKSGIVVDDRAPHCGGVAYQKNSQCTGTPAESIAYCKHSRRNAVLCRPIVDLST